jgi:predicted enzyme related to lactoylglutathione lyase
VVAAVAAAAVGAEAPTSSGAFYARFMSEPVITVSTVVINTTDPQRLADFWKEILGVGIGHQFSDFFIWLRPQEDRKVSLAFQKVPDPTPGRNRLHLDSTVPDVAIARARIETLGGSHVEDHSMSGYEWSVMADPDGNEFCIVKAGS